MGFRKRYDLFELRRRGFCALFFLNGRQNRQPIGIGKVGKPVVECNELLAGKRLCRRITSLCGSAAFSFFTLYDRNC